MRRLILGTAGHIDHGKTALVKAMTGVDTDRLKEEKERGITVDLGFAEYTPGETLRFGVVDVPGHEGFIRNMVAGATGMDLVLLVVAADEGVMPQTREHLAIVGLLGVPKLAVAMTKCDLAEEAWQDLVEDEIREVLDEGPYRGSPITRVSAVSGAGLENLGLTLVRLAGEAEEEAGEDLARLPMDRVFTIRGAGTVVTGTLWTGTLKKGQGVRILPGEVDARVRSLQLHGEEVEVARAGTRVAVGISGGKTGHGDLVRGQNLVDHPAWEISWMLTCRLSLLTGTGWALEQGQRVRVHHGTAEVLARAALLDRDRLNEGEEGWVQLRLEEPLLARARDRLVIRSYSPVTTMGGGEIVEVQPRKRRRMAEGEEADLTARLLGSPRETTTALLRMVGWEGVPLGALPQRTGIPLGLIPELVAGLARENAVFRIDDRLFSADVRARAETRILSRLEGFHRDHPLRTGMPLEELRQTLPGDHGPTISEEVLQGLVGVHHVEMGAGLVRLASFRPVLSPEQEALKARLVEVLQESSLTPPSVREMAQEMGDSGELEAILRVLEEEGVVLQLEPGLYFHRQQVEGAGIRVVRKLSGKKDLGPAQFRQVLPVTRKHLLPLLKYFDVVGVTTRMGEGREVANQAPAGWGTKTDP